MSVPRAFARLTRSNLLRSFVADVHKSTVCLSLIHTTSHKYFHSYHSADAMSCFSVWISLDRHSMEFFWRLASRSS